MNIYVFFVVFVVSVEDILVILTNFLLVLGCTQFEISYMFKHAIGCIPLLGVSRQRA